VAEIMSHLSAQLLAILLLIALIVAAGPYLLRLGGVEDAVGRLQAELQQRLPIYSAETLRHKEAEFIRDRIPNRFPAALVIAVLVLCAAAAWWLTH